MSDEAGANSRDHPLDARLLALLVAIALLLRLAVASQLRLIEVDGAYWCGLAQALARGDWKYGLSAAWPPLFPAAIAITERGLAVLGGPPTPALFEWSARLVSCVAGALLLIPLASLMRRLAPAAIVPALIVAAVHPRLIEYSAAALSESLFTLALIGGIALLVAAETDERRAVPKLGEAGACFGAAFLTRPEGLLIGAAVWAVACLQAAPATHRSRLRLALPFALLVVSLPWLLFLRAETGAWTLGEKGAYNFWRTHRVAYARHFAPPQALPARVNRSRELAPAADPHELHLAEFVRREPAAVAGRTLSQFATLAVSSLPVAAGWPVAVLAALGMWVARAGPWRLVFAPIAALLLVVAPISTDRRFVVPLVPLAVLLAGVALADLRRLGPWIARGATGALALGLLIYAAGIPARADRAPEQRSAGEWLAGSAAPASRSITAVMARKPWVAYYGGALIADLPDAPLDSILADAARTGVTVLVADARAARGDRPQIAPWLSRTPQGWGAILRESGADSLVLLSRHEP